MPRKARWQIWNVQELCISKMRPNTDASLAGLRVMHFTLGQEALLRHSQGAFQLTELTVDFLSLKLPSWRHPARVQVSGFKAHLKQRQLPQVGRTMTLDSVMPDTSAAYPVVKGIRASNCPITCLAYKCAACGSKGSAKAAAGKRRGAQSSKAGSSGSPTVADRLLAAAGWRSKLQWCATALPAGMR